MATEDTKRHMLAGAIATPAGARVRAAPAGTSPLVHVYYTSPERGSGHMAQAQALAKSLRKEGARVELVNIEERFSTPEKFSAYKRSYDNAIAGKSGNTNRVYNWIRFYMGGGIDKAALTKDVRRADLVVTTNPSIARLLDGGKSAVSVVHPDAAKVFASSWLHPNIGNRAIHYQPGPSSARPNGKYVGLRNPLVDPDVFSAKRLVPLDNSKFNIILSGGSMGTDVDLMASQLSSQASRTVGGKPVVLHAVVAAGTETPALLTAKAALGDRLVIHKKIGDVLPDLRGLYNAGDLIVTRPHGTSATEALVSGTPPVFVGRGGIVPSTGKTLRPVGMNSANLVALTRKFRSIKEGLTGGKTTAPTLEKTVSSVLDDFPAYKASVTADTALHGPTNTAEFVAKDILTKTRTAKSTGLPLAAVATVGALTAAGGLAVRKFVPKYIHRIKTLDGWKYVYRKPFGGS